MNLRNRIWSIRSCGSVMLLSRRWVFLVLGGALCTPFALLGLIAVPLALPDLADASPATGAVVGGTVVGVALVSAGFLPVVRLVEAATTPTLLGGSAADLVVPKPVDLGDRFRMSAWFLLHTILGAIVSVAWLLGATIAVALVVGSLHGRARVPAIGSEGTVLPTPTAIGAAVALPVALLLLTWGAGAMAARLAPALLGPGPRARLAHLERRTRMLIERNELARELHDSIGHALTVITLQTSAARTTLDNSPHSTRQTLDVIEETGRQAAEELDGVLALLRQDDSADMLDIGQSGLQPLVDAHGASGLPVQLDEEIAEVIVPDDVRREIYRVAQEALTNVRRHAGEPATVVTLAASPTKLSLTVTNEAPTGTGRVRRAATRGGRGLAGANERIIRLGGRLESGPDGHGGWRVSAEVPL